jgi:hypothetical protein
MKLIKATSKYHISVGLSEGIEVCSHIQTVRTPEDSVGEFVKDFTEKIKHNPELYGDYPIFIVEEGQKSGILRCDICSNFTDDSDFEDLRMVIAKGLEELSHMRSEVGISNSWWEGKNYINVPIGES